MSKSIVLPTEETKQKKRKKDTNMSLWERGNKKKCNRLIIFSTIKKLYPHYLKKVFNWTFWLTLAIGFLWILVRMIIHHQIEKDNKEKEASGRYSEKVLQEEKIFLSFFTTNFPDRGLTINDIFFRSLFSFLLYGLSIGGTFIVEPTVRSLLAFTRPTNILKETKKRTGEDEMVLVYATPIRRREMVLSKMLAFITRYLIVSFVFLTLPHLINPHNLRLDNWALLIKFFFFSGFLFPLIFSSLFAFYFWSIEISYYISYLLWNCAGVVFLAAMDGNYINEKAIKLFSRTGLVGQGCLVIFFLLWGFFFTHLHIQDFEEIQFS